MWTLRVLYVCVCVCACVGLDDGDSGERDTNEYNITRTHTKSTVTDDDADTSEEHIGAAVTQVYKHPYAASLHKNNSYVCSAVVLNTYWLLTLSKCFDPTVISAYVSHKHLGVYTIRTGSNYNNKGGGVSEIKMLVNNFDFKVSAVKMTAPLTFDETVGAVGLPAVDDDVSLGHLATMLAWTPSGHIRIVNAPVIDSSICEPSTKQLPGHYICVGGVQDPNRHFCRKDNGGAVIQNNTLIAITAFLHTCALYTKTHAFPKGASFSRWLDSVIWDENNRPTTSTSTTTAQTTFVTTNTTEAVDRSPYFGDPRKYMLTLPFDPVNVPLEPAEDNSVIPRMSLYESYLHNLAMSRTSTQPTTAVDEKKKWFDKFGKVLLMKQMYPKKYDYDYN